MAAMIEAPVRSGSHKSRVEAVDTLVLHYTELDLEQSLEILRHGAVSVHYVLAEDGDIYRLLGEERVAFHAGLSQWRGRAAVNERSVGIEIVNRNGNHYPYPKVQIAALIGLCQEILGRNPAIAAANVVGHSDISPKRKIDPGVLFPWEELAAAGIGLWPEKGKEGEPGKRTEVVELLGRCGYPGPHGYGLRDGRPDLFAHGETVRPQVDQVVWVDEADILGAFQRRYRPGKIDGVADGPTLGLLRELARLVA
jgi:N-acetylmuramoyl-L-alanine amidase